MVKMGGENSLYQLKKSFGIIIAMKISFLLRKLESLTKINPTKRHYYEIVKENSPCRLYFDLEYEK